MNALEQVIRDDTAGMGKKTRCWRFYWLEIRRSMRPSAAAGNNGRRARRAGRDGLVVRVEKASELPCHALLALAGLIL